MLLSSKGLGCPQTHHQLTFEVSLQRVWDEIPTHDYINLDDKFLDAGWGLYCSMGHRDMIKLTHPRLRRHDVTQIIH